VARQLGLHAASEVCNNSGSQGQGAAIRNNAQKRLWSKRGGVKGNHSSW
jgi:hypothetical protein